MDRTGTVSFLTITFGTTYAIEGASILVVELPTARPQGCDEGAPRN